MICFLGKPHPQEACRESGNKRARGYVRKIAAEVCKLIVGPRSKCHTSAFLAKEDRQLDAVDLHWQVKYAVFPSMIEGKGIPDRERGESLCYFGENYKTQILTTEAYRLAFPESNGLGHDGRYKYLPSGPNSAIQARHPQQGVPPHLCLVATAIYDQSILVPTNSKIWMHKCNS
jgi:hypothetical protein